MFKSKMFKSHYIDENTVIGSGKFDSENMEIKSGKGFNSFLYSTV